MLWIKYSLSYDPPPSATEACNASTVPRFVIIIAQAVLVRSDFSLRSLSQLNYPYSHPGFITLCRIRLRKVKPIHCIFIYGIDETNGNYALLKLGKFDFLLFCC